MTVLAGTEHIEYDGMKVACACERLTGDYSKGTVFVDGAARLFRGAWCADPKENERNLVLPRGAIRSEILLLFC